MDYQGFVSAQDPRTMPGYNPAPPTTTAPIRTLQSETNTAPQSDPSGDNPESNFGLALMSLLKQHQQLGTAPLQNQQLNLSDKQAQAGTNAALDPSLQGYAPGVINGARTNAQAPYSPLIQGSGNDQQTMSEQIRSLGSGITAAQSFLKTNIDQQNKTRDDARTLIHQSFTDFGGEAFDQLNPKDQADLEKKAGLPSGYIHGVGKTIKERELELKKQLASDKASAKSEKDAQADADKQAQTLDAYNLAGSILGSDLAPVTGTLQLRSHIPGTAAQYTANQINQLKGFLSLENRAKLKGSGAISDFEAKTLGDAASSLDRNLSEKDFKRELSKVRGVLATTSGGKASVTVKDSKTGKTKSGKLGRSEIADAIKQGYQIEYQ